MNQKIIPSTYDWPLGLRPSGLDHSVDFICGNCGAVLLHSEDGRLHDPLMLCGACGAHNSAGEGGLEG